MSIIGIQGQILEVTVVGCNKLKDTEWMTKQDPYVCLEYSSAEYRTKTCTDGGKNPTFNHKFKLELIEGYVEIKIMVWNENKVSSHKFIGSGRVLLQKVLSQGFDDDTWPLQTTSGRDAGEVKLVLHYSNALKPATTTSFSPSYVTPSIPQVVPPFPIPAVHYSFYAPILRTLIVQLAFHHPHSQLHHQLPILPHLTHQLQIILHKPHTVIIPNQILPKPHPLILPHHTLQHMLTLDHLHKTQPIILQVLIVSIVDHYCENQFTQDLRR